MTAISAARRSSAPESTAAGAATSALGADAMPDPAAVLAQARTENFPVALRLLPTAARGHLMALYGYARLIDDIGDATNRTPEARAAALDAAEADLDRLYAGQPPRHPLIADLAATVRACALPRQPLHALIAANRQDLMVSRYDTYDELRGYCSLSADPVGRLVLGVFGVATPERIAYSDRVCTALQLVEHCQDVAEDRRRGRIYLPAQDMARFGVTESDLDAATTPDAVRKLVAFEAARARGLLDAGAPLVSSLRGTAPRGQRRQGDTAPRGRRRHGYEARIAVAGFVAGGRAALAALARADYDVLAGPPRARRTEIGARTTGLLLASLGSRRC